jgi:hypothetical protein
MTSTAGLREHGEWIGSMSCSTGYSRSITASEVTPLCPAGHLPLKGGDQQNGLPLEPQLPCLFLIWN